MSVDQIGGIKPQPPSNLQGRVSSYRDTGITFADLIRDKDILELAWKDAKDLINTDPGLKNNENKGIKEEYYVLNKNSILWKYIS